MAHSIFILTAHGSNSGSKQHPGLPFLLAADVLVALLKLAKLAKLDRLISKIHFAKELEATKNAIEARFFLKDAISGKLAVNVQA